MAALPMRQRKVLVATRTIEVVIVHDLHAGIALQQPPEQPDVLPLVQDQHVRAELLGLREPGPDRVERTGEIRAGLRIGRQQALRVSEGGQSCRRVVEDLFHAALEPGAIVNVQNAHTHALSASRPLHRDAPA